MYVKQDVAKRNADSEERLTLRAISQMAESTVDPQVTRALTILKYKIVLEIGIDDGVIIGVFGVKTGDKVCTFTDFKKMMSIRSILMSDLEARNKGSKRSVAELTLAACEGVKATALSVDSLRKLMGINPWIIGFKKILKAIDEVGNDIPNNRFVQAMVNLGESYARVLNTLLSDVRKRGAKVNMTDKLYSEMANRGIPQWFHRSVILAANDFKAKITTDNPYRMFFSPTGTGGIYLTGEELITKDFLHKFVGLVGSVYDSSNVLEHLINRIHQKDEDLVAGGFVPTTYAEGITLGAFKWSLVINLNEDEVEGFFTTKSKNKSCPLMPFGALTLADRLGRLNLAIIRASHMEGQDVDTTVNLFSNIFEDGEDIIRSDVQANLFYLAMRVDNYSQRYSSYLKMEDDALSKLFVSMIGRLMSVSILQEKFGAVTNALNNLDRKDLVFENEKAVMELLYNKLETPEQKAAVANKGKKITDDDFWIKGSLKEMLTLCVSGPDELQSVMERKILRNYSLAVWLVDKENHNLKSEGLAAFRKAGKYYLPVELDEKPDMERIEKTAEQFSIKEKDENLKVLVGINQIHPNVGLIARKAKLIDCLSPKLFNAVKNLVKCFNEELMQKYVVDVTIATYDDFARGNTEAVESYDDSFG